MGVMYAPKLGPDILLAAASGLSVNRKGPDVQVVFGKTKVTLQPLLARALALKILAVTAEVEVEGVNAGWWPGTEKAS